MGRKCAGKQTSPLICLSARETLSFRPPEPEFASLAFDRSGIVFQIMYLFLEGQVLAGQALDLGVKRGILRRFTAQFRESTEIYCQTKHQSQRPRDSECPPLRSCSSPGLIRSSFHRPGDRGLVLRRGGLFIGPVSIVGHFQVVPSGLLCPRSRRKF